MKAKANNKKEYSIVSKSETNKIYLLKKDWDDLCELITEAYNGNTDIKAVYKQMRKINPI